MPVYLLQQAERRTEYQEDIEKKKQELYAEIDSFQLKDKTQDQYTEKVFVGQRNLEFTRYGLSVADFLRTIFKRK